MHIFVLYFCLWWLNLFTSQTTANKKMTLTHVLFVLAAQDTDLSWINIQDCDIIFFCFFLYWNAEQILLKFTLFTLQMWIFPFRFALILHTFIKNSRSHGRSFKGGKAQNHQLNVSLVAASKLTSVWRDSEILLSHKANPGIYYE